MIFTRREARAISSGRKTEHRISLGRAVPEIGAELTVTYPRSDPALGYGRNGLPKVEPVTLCRLRVLATREAILQDATPAQAAAEGYRSRNEMLKAWGDPEKPLRVTVLTIEADHAERPRFLSNGIIAGRQSDYVESRTRAISDAECVDEHSLKGLTDQARVRDQLRELRRRDDRAEMSFDEQLSALAAEARHRHVDIRDELRAITRWRDPVACQRQLEAIRRKLEPDLDAVA